MQLQLQPHALAQPQRDPRCVGRVEHSVLVIPVVVAERGLAGSTDGLDELLAVAAERLGNSLKPLGFQVAGPLEHVVAVLAAVGVANLERPDRRDEVGVDELVARLLPQEMAQRGHVEPLGAAHAPQRGRAQPIQPRGSGHVVHAHRVGVAEEVPRADVLVDGPLVLLVELLHPYGLVALALAPPPGLRAPVGNGTLDDADTELGRVVGHAGDDLGILALDELVVHEATHPVGHLDGALVEGVRDALVAETLAELGQSPPRDLAPVGSRLGKWRRSRGLGCGGREGRRNLATLLRH